MRIFFTPIRDIVLMEKNFFFIAYRIIKYMNFETHFNKSENCRHLVNRNVEKN
jgi:hypothetical protein